MEAGEVFYKDVLVVDPDVFNTGGLQGLSQFLGRGDFALQGFLAEPPKVNDRPQGGVESAVGALVKVQSEAHETRKFRRDLKGDIGRGSIETRELALQLVVGYLAVHLLEPLIHLCLERFNLSFAERRVD